MGTAFGKCVECAPSVRTQPASASAPSRSAVHGARAEPAVRIVRRTLSTPHSTRQLLKLHVKAQRQFASVADAVKRPHGASRALWIDIHLVDFCNQLAGLWALVEGKCASRCGDAQMRAGDRRVYRWNEEVLSCGDYVRRVLDSAASLVADARVFPLDERAPYPPDFERAARQTLVRVARCYAHLYHAHFAALKHLGRDHVCNADFARFVAFSLRFDLVSRREFEPVHELVHHLLPRPRCDSHFHGQDAKRDGDDRGGDEGHAHEDSDGDDRGGEEGDAHEAEGECEKCEDLEAESAASLSDAEPERPRDRTAAAAAASEETAALLRDLHALEPVREDDESGLSQSATPRRPPRHPDERALSPSRRLASDEQDAHSFDHDESSATARVSSSVDLRRTLATRQPAPLPAP